jgi:hypothetical protein
MNYALRSRLLGSALGSRIAQWTQRGFIRSIQRGTVTIGAVTSATATITAVDMANSVLLYGGFQNDVAAAAYDQLFPRVELTNATTVTAVKTTAANTEIIAFEVIEFYPGVLRSVQRGVISSAGVATNTATITAVTVAKASVVTLAWTGVASGGGGEMQQTTAHVVLTNATTVTLTRGSAVAGSLVGGYQVVEFY